MAAREKDIAWQWVEQVTRPILRLADSDYLDAVASRLHEAGVQDAMLRHDSGPLVDLLLRYSSLQGISDERAFAWDAQHGGVTHAAITAALASRPACPELKSYWHFRCGYRKGLGQCARPNHQAACPVPQHPLRKGLLNVLSYSLGLFVRDVCDGDLIAWIDDRLRQADPGRGVAGRAQAMRQALVEPLRSVHGYSYKLLNMSLAEILLGADLGRERWVTTGESMLSVDTVVHNLLHRVGVLRRLGADHPLGPRCYGPGGCATVIEELASRFDARTINPAFPQCFPRLVQSALWSFGSAGELNICNGNNIDDSRRCQQCFCPASKMCARVQLR